MGSLAQQAHIEAVATNSGVERNAVVGNLTVCLLLYIDIAEARAVLASLLYSIEV